MLTEITHELVVAQLRTGLQGCPLLSTHTVSWSQYKLQSDDLHVTVDLCQCLLCPDHWLWLYTHSKSSPPVHPGHEAGTAGVVHTTCHT